MVRTLGTPAECLMNGTASPSLYVRMPLQTALPVAVAQANTATRWRALASADARTSGGGGGTPKYPPNHPSLLPKLSEI